VLGLHMYRFISSQKLQITVTEEDTMNQSNLISQEEQAELIAFIQSLVRTKSLSGQEEAAIRLIESKMNALGYDEVIIDSMGNLLGRIGQGDKTILFDSHVDTVEVNDADKWDIPPFSGAVIDGRLRGRGSADMKSGAAASIYAAALARRLGLDSGKTIYVSCGVFEEDCDGENLKHMFNELNLKPDYVVICEPSDNKIALGHKGKAQISIKTHGVSAHGSAPEKGVNAIYEMSEIIQRVEKANTELMKKDGFKGTLVMSRISSTSASLNAVPSECEAYLDRRTVPGETEDAIRQEMDQLIRGKNATWDVGTVYRKSWTGMEIKYQPFHPAWNIDLDHALTRACIAAYAEIFGRQPAEYVYWDFSTDAVTPVSLGIPTIGFGPGDPKLAHMRNESCPINQIIEACGFYTRLIHKI
jgi:putative selenium metabolism hydrolase